MFGLIIRRTALTESFISREVDRFRRHFGGEPDSDEYLVALSLAMSYPDLQHAAKELTDAGCELGQDFVETASVSGVLGGVPPWLCESLEKSVVSEETRSKYSPEIIATMEAQPWRVYSFVKVSDDDA